MAVLVGPSTLYVLGQAMFLFIPWGSETTWRTLGGLLQIAAVIEILVDVSAVRRRLVPGYVSLRGRVTRLAGRLLDHLPWRRRHVTVHAGTAHGTVSMSSFATAKTRRSELGMTVEERLAYHRHLIDELEVADEAIRREIAVDRDRVYKHITKLTDELRSEVRAVDALHRDVATGGLRLRMWSVVALVIGIALSTWAPEIASLFD